MNQLTLYGTNPFDLIDRVFGDDSFFTPGMRTPLVDVSEDKEAYRIEAELPGLNEKDISLEIREGALVLSSSGDKNRETAGEGGRYLRRERSSYRFTRNFELPEDVDVEKIEAKFRDGLLSISLPKKPEAAPRIVPVKVA